MSNIEIRKQEEPAATVRPAGRSEGKEREAAP